MRAQHGSTAGYMTYALRALHARSSRRFSGAVLGGLLAAAAASCCPRLSSLVALSSGRNSFQIPSYLTDPSAAHGQGNNRARV